MFQSNLRLYFGFCIQNNYFDAPISIKMYMKIFTMSTYKFKAAKMYSSGEIEYLCFPPEINNYFFNFQEFLKS